jgi:amidase
VGPLARWVEDLELIGDIIRGPDYIDAAIVPAPWLDPKAVDLKKFRVAYYINNGSKIAPTAETAAAVKKAVGIFAAIGATVTEDCPAELIKESSDLRNALSTADGRAWVKRLLKKYGTTEVSPTTALDDEPRAGPGRFTELAELMDANRSKFLQWFDKYDLIIAPVMPGPAEKWPDQIKATAPSPGNYGHTPIYNNLGWPGAVVRAGGSPDGLPIGVQLIAHPMREDISLAAAYLVEAGTGGYQKPTAI